MALHYLEGDATKPVGTAELKIIAHVCNDAKKWGKGFVLALSSAYPEAKRWFLECDLGLGCLQLVPCEGGVVVANMVAQRDVFRIKDGSRYGCPPLRYPDLYDCMGRVASWAKEQKKACEIHAPKFGSGLSGGDWRIVELFIKELWADFEVYVYTPPVPHESFEDIFNAGRDGGETLF